MHGLFKLLMLLPYKFDLALQGNKCHQARLLCLLELHAKILHLELVLLHSFLVFRLRLGKHLSDLLLLVLHLCLDLELHRLHLLLRFFLEVLLDLLDHGHLSLKHFFHTRLRLLRQRYLLAHCRYVFFLLLELRLQLSDLFLKNGPLLHRLKLDLLEFAPEGHIFTFQTLPSFLLRL